MLEKIKQLTAEIESFTTTSLEEVEQFRIKHLSKKGTIAALFDDFKNVPAEQKKDIGKALNELKNAALNKINELKESLCDADNGATGIDLTLPGDPLKMGTRHPLSLVKNEILAIFNKLGFTISEGPEIEDDWHNFSALNFPEEHPARDMQDTFSLKKSGYRAAYPHFVRTGTRYGNTPASDPPGNSGTSVPKRSYFGTGSLHFPSDRSLVHR